MEKVTVTGTKGQIVIPIEMRRKIGLEPGQRVAVALEGDVVVLRPVPKDLVAAMTGCLKGRTPLTDELVKEHAEEVRQDAKGDL